MNRVPVATAPALDGGRLLHHIFERHFSTGEPLVDAAKAEAAAFKALLAEAPEGARYTGEKALTIITDLTEAFPLWKDQFKADEILAVEEAYEMQDPVMKNVIWLVRPDVEIRKGKTLYHRQNRGLSASMNFAMYVRLMNRHYHEHLYAEAISEKYKLGKKLKYGGTHVNLVRKLKFRTNVGKSNEATKTAEEMFYQQTMFVDLNSPIHKSVMASLRYHTRRMIRAMREWETERLVPSPNEKMNGGYSGNSDDLHFRLLMGEIKLDDNRYFKNREILYDLPNQEET